MRVCMLALSAAVLSTAAVASDVPKEGKATGTFSSVGTYRAISVGKNLTGAIFDETGLSVGTAPFEHMTLHCIGVYSNINGVEKSRGHCQGTDPSGDQLFGEFVAELKSNSGTGKSTYLGGTGKFEGITGNETYTLEGGNFKVSADLTYVQHGTYESHYKFK